ncbi:hypothetical protein [Oricola sp.]|uniref:hypothetical protein n=1 Tax=Oricola sp. TaxID=1979950 RepID=UPI002600FBEC|nr:hypothetical protein [Oricola sp.]MCI5078420.1 hypothetical protein [Oricola sp.]
MAAAEALIVLSLLGCDDSGAQCDFVRVGTERYETVEACRAASEPLLAATLEADYPTVVAVCSPESALPMASAVEGDQPDATGAEVAAAALPPESPFEGEAPLPPEGEAQIPAETPAEMPAEEEKAPGLLARVGRAIGALTPDRETLTKPIDLAADGAATVGGAVIVGVRRVADAVNPF